MANHRTPVGAHLCTQRRAGHGPAAAVGVVDAIGAIRVVGPGQTLHALCLGGNVLYASGNAVIHIGEEVVALVPALMGYVDSQPQGHCCMARVAPALIRLPQLAIGTCLQLRLGGGDNQVSPELGESVIQDGVSRAWVFERAHLVILDERHALVIDEDIVAKHTDGNDCQRVAQSPVAPVVTRCLPPLARIFPRAVAVAQEADATWIPHVEHPSLELPEVLTAPPLIVAHQFSSLCKLVAIQSPGQTLVRGATDGFRGVTPGHQDPDGSIGIGFCTVNLPAQGILVGNGGSACCIDVVFARTATDNGLGRIGLTTRL